MTGPWGIWLAFWLLVIAAVRISRWHRRRTHTRLLADLADQRASRAYWLKLRAELQADVDELARAIGRELLPPLSKIAKALSSSDLITQYTKLHQEAARQMLDRRAARQLGRR